jgi:hypothetical protein
VADRRTVTVEMPPSDFDQMSVEVEGEIPQDVPGMRAMEGLEDLIDAVVKRSGGYPDRIEFQHEGQTYITLESPGPIVDPDTGELATGYVVTQVDHEMLD